MRESWNINFKVKYIFKYLCKWIVSKHTTSLQIYKFERKQVSTGAASCPVGHISSVNLGQQFMQHCLNTSATQRLEKIQQDGKMRGGEILYVGQYFESTLIKAWANIIHICILKINILRHALIFHFQFYLGGVRIFFTTRTQTSKDVGLRV